MLAPHQLRRARAGAVVYHPGSPAEEVLAEFAAALAARGWRVGGLIQRTLRGADGRKTDMLLTELDTGRTFSIAQSLGRGAMGDACTVDAGALCEATAALRRAIAADVDLMVVNKFSHHEKSGRGFADEMLAAMAEGVPLLTAVPANLLAEWSRFCGGRCQLLAPEPAALWRWWGPHRLYDDLLLGVGDGAARRVVIGVNWTMVEGPDGVGLAATPARDTPGCRGGLAAGDYAGRPLRDLAGLVRSWDPFELAIGMAAVNAAYNRFDLAGEELNGLDVLPPEGRVTVIGGFPGIAGRLAGCHVVERFPGPGEYPEAAAEWLLPASDAVVVTASTVANRSLPRLLELADGARVVLVGPSAPLADRLFAFGVDAVSGIVAVDVEALARTVAEGGGARAIKRHARQVTLRAAASPA